MTSTRSVRQRLLTPPTTNDEDQSLRHLAPYNTVMPTYPAYPTPPQHSVYGDPSHYHATQPSYYQAGESSHYQHPHEGLYTRSGKTLGSPMMSGHGPERRSKSPKPKKSRKTNTKPKTAVINGPLSEVTKDYSVPIKNMEEWVNRSAEVRRAEAAKKSGYVARPMNSFMMYRSAYAERIKLFCKENNHQIVSQVSGASWPQEPKEVRDFYERLAMTERENHQKAHPEYKFAPNKNANIKKRKSFEGEDDSEGEDPTYGGRGGSSKRSRSEQHSARTTPFENRPVLHPLTHLHQSPWEPNTGRHMQHMGPATDMQAQYYQAPVAQYVPNIEEVGMRRTVLPVARSGTPLVGMPGGTHQELLQPHSQMSTPIPPEGQMDPALMYEGNHHYAPVEEYATHYQYGPTSGMSAVEHHQYTSAPAYHPGLQTLTDDRGWGGPGSDFDRELGYQL